MKNAILKWIPLLVLPVLLVPMQARAAPVTYDVVFTKSFGNAPAAAEFTYDTLTGDLKGPSITWEGVTFDRFIATGDDLICGTGPSAIIFLLLKDCGLATLFEWRGYVLRDIAIFEFFAVEPETTQERFVAEIEYEGHGPVRSAEGGWTTTPRVTAVPEPGTLALLGLGLAGLGFTRRRRQTTQV